MSDPPKKSVAPITGIESIAFAGLVAGNVWLCPRDIGKDTRLWFFLLFIVTSDVVIRNIVDVLLPTRIPERNFRNDATAGW